MTASGDTLPTRPAPFVNARTPVHHDESSAAWNVFSYDDTRRVLLDTTTFSASYGVQEADYPHVHPAFLGMWASDGKRHTDLRAAVAQPFRPRVLDMWRPRVEGFADDLLDRVLARGDGQVEIVTELAEPLSLQVICLILGLDTSHAATFDDWVKRPARAGQPDSLPPMPEQQDFFRELIQQRRARPQDGLVDHLIAQHDAGYVVDDRPMTEWDLIGYFAMLLKAGYETTAAGISNAVLYLTEFELMEELKAEPALIPGAVEETLRWCPPFPAIRRQLTADAQFGAQTIPAGSSIVGWISSANHDPDQFSDPGNFDIRRSPNRHLSFGHGVLNCLGAPLARMELAIAVEALAMGLPGLHRDGSKPLQRTYGLVDSLPSLWCTFDAEAPATRSIAAR